MTTEQTALSTETPVAAPKKGRGRGPFGSSSRVVLLALIAVNARIGRRLPAHQQSRGDRRSRGRSSRCSDTTTGSVCSRSSRSSRCRSSSRSYVWAWRRYGPPPGAVDGLVCTLIVWQDPIMNWAPYAVYNPQLWHWPEDWPLVSLSPTVEPFLVIGYSCSTSARSSRPSGSCESCRLAGRSTRSYGATR